MKPRLSVRLWFPIALPCLAALGGAVAAPPSGIPARLGSPPASTAPTAPAAGAAGVPATRPVVQGIPRATAPLEPYVAFAWSTPPRRWASPRVQPFLWINEKEPSPVAAARATQRIPEGRRVLFTRDLLHGLLAHPGDVARDAAGNSTGQQGVWPEQGVRAVGRRVGAFFDAFAAAGGVCDLLVLDFEEGYSVWGPMTPQRLAAIERDPRYRDPAHGPPPPVVGPAAAPPAASQGAPGAAQRDAQRGARPAGAARQSLAERLGLRDLPSTVPWRPGDAGEYLKWNSVAAGIVNDALNRAVGRPLWRHFPGAWMSNYDSAVMAPQHVVPEVGGHLQYLEGPPAGNCQSPVLYGWVGQVAIRYPHADWKRPLTVVIQNANTVRAIVRSADLPVLPWLAARSWRGDNPQAPNVTLARTPYWQENLYHAMLSGAASNVLFWNLPDAGVPRHRQADTSSEDAAAMSEALAEMSERAGGSRLVQPLLNEAVDLKADVLVSAALTESGRVVARVTFGDGIDAATVTIGGRRYEVARPAGQVGAWVDVTR